MKVIRHKKFGKNQTVYKIRAIFGISFFISKAN